MNDEQNENTESLPTGADVGLPTGDFVVVASDRSDEPTDPLADTVPASAVEAAEAAIDLDPVLRALHTISEETGAGLEDLAEAFVALRAETATDEQALEVLLGVAFQAKKNPEAKGATVTELAVSLAATAADLAEAKKRLVRDATPKLTSADGKTPLSNVLPLRRGVGKSTIVVEGGTKGPKLPPADDFSGKPTPEAEAAVKAGATAYHLDTLDTLEAEAKDADEAVRVLTVDQGEEVSNPGGAARVFRSPPTMRSPASAVMFAMAGIAAALSVSPEPSNAPRLEAQRQGRESARRRKQKLRTTARHISAEDRANGLGCGAAACRTLDSCLCSGKCCRNCPRKK